MLKLCLIFIVFLFTAMHVQSQNIYTPPSFSDPKRLEKIQKIYPKILKIYQDYAAKNHIPGYAFGLMVDGKLVYSGSSGVSDLVKKKPVSLQSLFRIASMTKSFTAMAILKLRDEGKLSLDDPAYLYIPELKDQKLTADTPNITIRSLLTHSAGFPEDNPWGDRQLAMNHEEFKTLLKQGLSYASITDSAFEYSNLGYTLLGMIIDKLAAMPYQEYIAKNIWQPLAMEQVAWDFSTIPSDKLVKGYRWAKDNWQEEQLLKDGSFGAMGGMYSSLEAFSHYVALFQDAWPPHDDLEKGPLKRSSLREMQRAWQFSKLSKEYKFLNGESCIMVESYGYGLRWFHDCESKTYVGHSGGLPGFGSNWLIIPEYGLGVIFLANVTYAPAADINFLVLNTLVKAANLEPKKYPVSKLLADRKKALTKLLPNWDDAESLKIFADNFFLDFSLEERKKTTQTLFKKAGKIIKVNPFIAENLLRGYFIINAENSDLKIYFTLSPRDSALIQELKIEELVSKNINFAKKID